MSKRLCVNCGDNFEPEKQDRFGLPDCHYHPDTPVVTQYYSALHDYSNNLYFPCCGITLFPRMIRMFVCEMPEANSLPGCIHGYHKADDRQLLLICDEASSADILEKYGPKDKSDVNRYGLLIVEERPEITKELMDDIASFDAYLLFITRASLHSFESLAPFLSTTGRPVFPYCLDDISDSEFQHLCQFQIGRNRTADEVHADIRRSARDRDRFWRWLADGAVADSNIERGS